MLELLKEQSYLIFIIHYKMDMLNISMYTQMGFPEKLVRQAYRYSQ